MTQFRVIARREIYMTIEAVDRDMAEEQAWEIINETPEEYDFDIEELKE